MRFYSALGPTGISPALNNRIPSHPIVNQIVHPPEVEAASSSDTELVGVGRVEAEERHVAGENGFDNLKAGSIRKASPVNTRKMDRIYVHIRPL